MSMQNNAVLSKCKNCGGTPELHRKGNKYYYECSGDCWNATGKHWNPAEAAEEWEQINSSDDGVELMPLKDLLKSCLHCGSSKSVCGACPLDGIYDCDYIRRDQLRRWIRKLSEGE